MKLKSFRTERSFEFSNSLAAEAVHSSWRSPGRAERAYAQGRRYRATTATLALVILLSDPESMERMPIAPPPPRLRTGLPILAPCLRREHAAKGAAEQDEEGEPRCGSPARLPLPPSSEFQIDLGSIFEIRDSGRKTPARGLEAGAETFVSNCRGLPGPLVWTEPLRKIGPCDESEDQRFQISHVPPTARDIHDSLFAARAKLIIIILIILIILHRKMPSKFNECRHDETTEVDLRRSSFSFSSSSTNPQARMQNKTKQQIDSSELTLARENAHASNANACMERRNVFRCSKMSEELCAFTIAQSLDVWDLPTPFSRASCSFCCVLTKC